MAGVDAPNAHPCKQPCVLEAQSLLPPCGPVCFSAANSARSSFNSRRSSATGKPLVSASFMRCETAIGQLWVAVSNQLALRQLPDARLASVRSPGRRRHEHLPLRASQPALLQRDGSALAISPPKHAKPGAGRDQPGGARNRLRCLKRNPQTQCERSKRSHPS